MAWTVYVIVLPTGMLNAVSSTAPLPFGVKPLGAAGCRGGERGIGERVGQRVADRGAGRIAGADVGDHDRVSDPLPRHGGAGRAGDARSA